MKSRPILFQGAMVRALLAGTKTQTRRVMKEQPVLSGNLWGIGGAGWSDRIESVPAVYGHSLAARCPYGLVGDRLWVRESYADTGSRLTYRADLDDGAHCKVKKWTPSIHMFRADSRIELEIVSVRVERLQAISEDDAYAEGIAEDQADNALMMAEAMSQREPTPARFCYQMLWEEINGAGSWDANPWVWVVEFRRLS